VGAWNTAVADTIDCKTIRSSWAGVRVERVDAGTDQTAPAAQVEGVRDAVGKQSLSSRGSSEQGVG
jgi:hypothetical protein